MPGGEIALAAVEGVVTTAVTSTLQWAARRISDHRQSYFEKQLASVAFSAGMDGDRSNHVITINDALPVNLIAMLLPEQRHEEVSSSVQELIMCNLIDGWFKHTFDRSCSCEELASRLYQFEEETSFPISLVASFGRPDIINSDFSDHLFTSHEMEISPKSFLVGEVCEIPHMITHAVLSSCGASRRSTSRNIVFGFLLQAVLATRGVPNTVVNIQCDHLSFFETEYFKSESSPREKCFKFSTKKKPEAVFAALNVVRKVWGSPLHRTSFVAKDLLNKAVLEANRIESLSSSLGIRGIFALQACFHEEPRELQHLCDRHALARVLIDKLRASNFRCIASRKDIRRFMIYGTSKEESQRHLASYRLNYSFYEENSGIIRSYIDTLDDQFVCKMREMDLRRPIISAVKAVAIQNNINIVSSEDRTLLPRSINFLMTRTNAPWSTRKQTLAFTTKSFAIATPILKMSVFMETGACSPKNEIPALGEKKDEAPYMVAVLIARILVDLNEFESLTFATKFLASLTSLPPSEVKEVMGNILRERLFQLPVTSKDDLLKLSSIYEISERLFGKNDEAVKTTFRTLSAIMQRGFKLVGTDVRCNCINNFFPNSTVPGVLVDRVVQFKDLVELKTSGGLSTLGVFRGGKWLSRGCLMPLGLVTGYTTRAFHVLKHDCLDELEECEEMISGNLV